MITETTAADQQLREEYAFRCPVCGAIAYPRDLETVKWGKSHYDCVNGHGFYPRTAYESKGL